MQNMTKKDSNKFLTNLLKFTAPVLGIFFLQLASGIDLRGASLVALYALYAAASDYFSKIK